MRPSELAAFISDVLSSCLGIRSVWSLDHESDAASVAAGPVKLLVFADVATLERLKSSPQARHPDVELFVVTDGELFESASGSFAISGSLARAAWRRSSACEAFYDEARWSSRGDDVGAVVRVRRKALLLWQAPANAPVG